MADTPIDDKRFTDQEVREILKMAVAKPASGGLVKHESDGLSLAELKAIGGEVGIDPSRLEDAARALAQRSSHEPNRFVGAPTSLHTERRVDAEIDPEDVPRILSVIRRGMGQKGEANEIGGAIEWSSKGEIGERLVALSTRDGKTTISASTNLSQAAVVTFLPGGILGLMASIIGFVGSANAEIAVGMVFFVMLLPMLYLALRQVFKKVSSSEDAKLQNVVDEVARLVEESQG